MSCWGGIMQSPPLCISVELMVRVLVVTGGIANAVGHFFTKPDMGST